MTKDFQLSRRARIGWFAGLAVLLIVSVTALFGLTNDSLVDGERSALAKQYTAVAADAEPSGAPEHSFPARFGVPGKASTLVLYDNTGNFADDTEMYAMATGNLASHFGQVEIMPVAKYSRHAIDRYDAVVYLGADAAADVPRAFLDDVPATDVPVLWVDQNLDELAGAVGPAAFTQRYGWNPLEARTIASDVVPTVEYKDTPVSRDAQGVQDLVAPMTDARSPVTVLATSQCREKGAAVSCLADDAGGPSEVPWALRSGNLTYVAEIPLDFIDRNDIYLVYADLFYDLLAPDISGSEQAAVRLEDVGPESDPEDLRAVADYLHGEGVPFQVAVMPIQIGPTPGRDDWYGLSLLDRPKVVEALKYMQERGGTLIQHGATHQFGAMDNPYSGRTGEDYEFYRYGCSSTAEQPYRFETCENDSYIRQIGPVAEDKVDQHVARMRQGRQVMIDAGLGEPKIFARYQCL